MEPATTEPRPRIIDAHAHIASVDYIPRSFIDGAVDNLMTGLLAQGVAARREVLTEMYLQHMRDASCDQLVAQMDEAGIERTVLLLADFTHALPDCTLSIEEMFLRHAQVLDRHPGRFEVFGGVDPRWGADGLALFERSIDELGFRGFKVYPPCGFSPSDPGLEPYYEICGDRGLPVTLHMGATSPALSFRFAHPLLLDEAARRFPRTNFILAHGATSFIDDCVMMCAYRPNVYLDVSGFQGSLRVDGPGGAIRHVISRGINHKVLFGTDWPVFRFQGDQPTAIAMVLAEDGPLEDLGEVERELLLHGNIERLLPTTDART